MYNLPPAGAGNRPAGSGGYQTVFAAKTVSEGRNLRGLLENFEKDAALVGKVLREYLSTGRWSVGTDYVYRDGQLLAAGSSKKIKDIDRLTKTYGGESGDWSKIRSSSYTSSDGDTFETHAYRNEKTGQIVEFKTKINPR